MCTSEWRQQFLYSKNQYKTVAIPNSLSLYRIAIVILNLGVVGIVLLVGNYLITIYYKHG